MGFKATQGRMQYNCDSPAMGSATCVDGGGAGDLAGASPPVRRAPDKQLPTGGVSGYSEADVEMLTG